MMLRRVYIYIVSLLLLACALEPDAPQVSAPPPPVQLKASVDKAEAVVGETITYTVTLDHDPAIQVEMPDVFSKQEGLLISDIRREGPVRRDGRTWYQQSLTLQALQEGSFLLPPLEVRWKDPAGQEQSTGAPQIFLEVKTALTEADAQEDIADIKDLEQPPPDYRRLALLAGGVGALMLLLAGAWVLWKRRKKASVPPPPPPPPWEVALRTLEQLQGQTQLEPGDEEAGRRFAFALSECVRRYIEERCGLRALEASTEEVLGQMHWSQVPEGEPRRLLRLLLLATDQVKFAKAPVTSEEARTWIGFARELVARTRPIEPPPEALDNPEKKGGRP